MSESRHWLEGGTSPSRLWLAVMIFLDCGWMFFDRAAYHPGNMTISYPRILAGTGCAPEQFRIAILTFASFVQRHSHLTLQEVVNVLDLASSIAVSFVLFCLLQRILARTRNLGDLVAPSLAAALLALLNVVNLHWAYYFVRPETVPGAFFVAISTLLVTKLTMSRTAGRSFAIAMLLIGLAIVQSFCRVDLSLSFAGAETLLAVMFLPAEVRSRRGALLTAGFCSGLMAVLIQLYLAKVRYPDAHYCGDVFTMRHNIVPFAVLIASLFLIPIFLGGWAMMRQFSTLDVGGRVVLIGACIHFPMYFCVGNLTETRIFVPYALGVSPWIAILAAKLLGDRDKATAGSKRPACAD